jgi:hypothetical protein
MIPIPANLPLLLGENEAENQAIERVIKGQTIAENLIDLSRFWKIKVWFDKPVIIRKVPNPVTEYVFSGFFAGTCIDICYVTRKGAHTGYSFVDMYNHVIKYEPVPTNDTFKSKEAFAKKFNPDWITTARIDELWNSKSTQTGKQYAPSDFKSLSTKGKWLLNQFLQYYKKDFSGNFYRESTAFLPKKVMIYSERHKTMGPGGRDITLSHQEGRDWIDYASEFPGCGNGTYGIIANRNEYLHLEDD